MTTMQREAEYVERARRIYTEDLLPRYAETHDGEYIVVDGRSGDHELGPRAYQRLRSRHPNAITFSIRVNRPTAGDSYSAWL